MTERALASNFPLGGGWKDEVSQEFHCCASYSFIALLFAHSIPVTARSKARVGSLSLTRIGGSNPAGVMDVSLL